MKAFAVYATIIQALARGFQARMVYAAWKASSIRIQSRYRMHEARTRYKIALSACISVQCWTRCLEAKAELQALRENHAATMIQTHWRMLMAISSFKRMRAASVVIQAQIRGSLQRPIYRKELAEAIEEAKLENQLKSLQKKLEEAEAKRIDAEKKAAEAAAESPKPEKVIVYREKEAEEEKPPVPAVVEEKKAEPLPRLGQLTQQQQMLMDESGKMLEFMRREVFKLRGQNAQLRSDFDLLKENNQRLMDANASAGASFAALNQHAKQLSKTNNKLMTELEKYKKATHKLNLLQVEAKEELKMKNASYVAEVQSRLQYQHTLNGVIGMVQERCRDVRLVEDILAMYDDCEANMDADGSAAGNLHMMADHSRADQQHQHAPDTNSNKGASGIFKSFFGGGY